MDVIAAAGGNEDTIAWWENDGSQSFTKQVIDSTFNGGWGVYAKDIDIDGDIDILAAATTADDVTWWENDGSESFTENTIEGLGHRLPSLPIVKAVSPIPEDLN